MYAAFVDRWGLGQSRAAYWHKSVYDRRFWWIDYLDHGQPAVVDDFGDLIPL